MKQMVAKVFGKPRLALTLLGCAGAAAGLAWWQTQHAGTIRTDNAFVFGHVTRLVSPINGAVDELALAPHSAADQGAVAFVLNKAEYELAITNASTQLRTALREELLKCSSRQAARYRTEQANAALDRSQTLLEQANNLVSKAYLPKDALLERQSSEKQALLNQKLAQLEGDKADYQLVAPLAMRSNVATAIHALSAALATKQRSTLRLDSDAYIYDVFVTRGQTISEGTLLATMVPDGPVEVQANVLESQYRQVRIGQSVDVRFDASPGQKTYRGRVSALVPAVAAAFSPVPRANTDSNWIKVSQRVPVIIALDEAPPASERPPMGSSAEVVIHAGAAARPHAPAAPTLPPPRRRPDEQLAQELAQHIQRVTAAEQRLVPASLPQDPACRSALAAAQPAQPAQRLAHQAGK
ncbi:HlyD family secretion protein [Pseudoduganella namucuonensis]|uniref:Multidrug resistance efflux pump n=1 Tax=Pseudoduganella namucuonensis TaxID=1035707 RepID=A0A1I7LXJ3_9BURK|nr:HlyD family efflux transporter periplasmic adaptor subunit [Pseudoduganella namucuonensis]SFV14426.1 Multidrug resistance efflux pump [Pseudoduganella namucuonensis]